jgi:acetolactate synthase-1/2/3 large subunit
MIGLLAMRFLFQSVIQGKTMAGGSRGADLVVQSLTSAGVEKLFALSGNQIMPIFDACIDQPLDLFHVRHEAAAVHMADAYARLTGELGIALVTAGPGFCNALSALYVALCAESPVVLLSGCSPRSLAGQGAFQEMPQAEMAGHVTKASWMAEDAARLGDDIARAIRIARSGRPGPVHIALPADVLNVAADVSQKALPRAEDFAPTLTLLDGRTAESVLDTLSQATRPMVLAGASLCRNGGPELLRAFQEQTGVPAIGMESPRGINDPCLGAFAEVLAEADLLVLVGKPLNFTLRLGREPFIDPACQVIQLDPEMRVLEQTAGNLGDAGRLLVSELTDAAPALERLTEMAAQKQWNRSDWCDEVTAAITYRPTEWNTATADDSQRRHPAEICRDIQTVLDESEEAVFISDGGEFGQWAQACITAPQRVINGTSGSIGSVIPFALAARVACPDARIVATLGDGTFGFQPAEFDTAVRYNLPFTAVVGNDACWNAEHQIQLRDYGPDRLFACDLLPTRYDEVVRSFGGHGESVSRNDDLVAALNRSFESNKPACMDAALERTAAPVSRR